MRGSTLYLSWTSIGAGITYNLCSACQTTPSWSSVSAYLSAFWRRQSQLPWVCPYQCPEPLPLQLGRSSLHPGACPGSVWSHQTSKETRKSQEKTFSGCRYETKSHNFIWAFESLLLLVQEWRTRLGAKTISKAPPWLKKTKQNKIVSLLLKPNCVCGSIILAKGVKAVPGQ